MVWRSKSIVEDAICQGSRMQDSAYMSTIPLLRFLPVLSGAYVRALPVSPSEQGKCGHILSPAILSHPHHGGPPTHRSRAPTRCSGAREASCIVVKPSHLVELTKETRYPGHRCVRASETSRFPRHALPHPAAKSPICDATYRRSGAASTLELSVYGW